MMTPVYPRLLNMITGFVLLRFWARASEDLSAIEVILLLLFKGVGCRSYSSLSIDIIKCQKM